MASSSSHSTHRWTYDVFVSFRGEDIRKSFVDHLFSGFHRKGIHAFRDDRQLPKGEMISSQLYKAIENSRILVVILSENYASSTWCLRELVKILECKDLKSHDYEVQTIFYDVKRSVVQNQTGSYEEAFRKHQALGKIEVPNWKKALTKAADLSGWDLQDMANGFESKFIDLISKDIFHRLIDGPLHVGENLVGIDTRAERMNLLQFVGSSEVHMIGICGIGGVGKTTIAKAIYNFLYVHFECYSFCEDVKGFVERHGMVQLQKQIIEDMMEMEGLKIRSVGEGISVMKKRFACRHVLIVLDNVDCHEHLEGITGSCDWFGPGSLIVLTGKDRQMLNAHGVEKIYNVEFLHDDEALELFSLYAFKTNLPEKGFLGVANQVVEYVGGHPLALKVLGCFLFGKTVTEWENELERFQMYPHGEIHQVLRLSYDQLDCDQKSIFLDIACFFIGSEKDFVAKILDACDFFADADIRVLVDRSLITISTDNRLCMHDLIRQMGWDIVREKSTNPGKWSRLWLKEDVYDVLMKSKGTEAVEGLFLDSKQPKVQIRGNAFARMNNLRLVKIEDALEINKGNILNFTGTLEFLSNEIRWLYWHGFPFNFLPSHFYPEKLVALDMSFSCIRQLWTESKDFGKLKSIKLSYCCNLTVTPDFTLILNLEELVLDGCTNLVEVHPSVGILKKLLVLNLESCKNLKNIPNCTEWESLQILNLSHCSKLKKLPDDLGKIKSLAELHVNGTAIKELPPSVSFLTNVQVLAFGLHEGIQYESWPFSLLREKHRTLSFELPCLSGLHLLKELVLSNCNLSEASLDTLGSLSLLEQLHLGGNDFSSIPSSFGHLSRLEWLDVDGCRKLQALPQLPPNLLSLQANNCTSLSELPKLPNCNGNYSYFYFGGCSKLVEDQSLESFANTLFQQGFNVERGFQLFVPGSRIPKWFRNQSMGDCITLELPPGWSYTKFRGMAYCFVFTTCRYSMFELTVSSFDDTQITCRVIGSETIWDGSDQIWLGYSTWGSWNRAKYWIKISIKVSEGECMVKKCGVRLVYDEPEQQQQQQEENGSRMIQWFYPPPNVDVKRSTTIEENVPSLKKSRVM